jgi:hypothetical protein
MSGRVSVGEDDEGLGEEHGVAAPAPTRVSLVGMPMAACALEIEARRARRSEIVGPATPLVHAKTRASMLENFPEANRLHAAARTRTLDVWSFKFWLAQFTLCATCQ